MGLIKKFRIKSYKKEENIVQLKNISVFYNKRQILDNLNLKIYKQEILGMLGHPLQGKAFCFAQWLFFVVFLPAVQKKQPCLVSRWVEHEKVTSCITSVGY